MSQLIDEEILISAPMKNVDSLEKYEREIEENLYKIDRRDSHEFHGWWNRAKIIVQLWHCAKMN